MCIVISDQRFLCSGMYVNNKSDEQTVKGVLWSVSELDNRQQKQDQEK